MTVYQNAGRSRRQRLQLSSATAGKLRSQPTAPKLQASYDAWESDWSDSTNSMRSRNCSENSISLLAPARPETPARHSKRVPNFVFQPNTELPGNENRAGSSAVR